MITAIKEKPILFSTPMVKAILEGRKTQTRRVIKDHVLTINDNHKQYWIHKGYGTFDGVKEPFGEWKHCLYGEVGDHLWVRETFYHDSLMINKVIYKADNPNYPTIWKPSIFMPRWASRITLEVSGVRVQRLQEMSLRDAIAEGVTQPNEVDHSTVFITNFKNLWDKLNAKRGYSWEFNPWVWVISFKRI